jgi:UTP--glucose-1-phosphate uridylyltransferase
VTQITDAVIPVGGLGTRLLPATRSQPKEMLPVVDKPVVQYVVEELVRAGIGRILFVTGRRKRAIEDHFDADPELGADPLLDPRTGLQILYTRQAHAAGLGDALRYGEALATQHGVVVALGDAIIETPASVPRAIVPRLIDAFTESGASAALAVEDVPSEAVSRYGIVVGDRRGDLIDVSDVIEKPAPDAVASRLAIAARYVLGPPVFAALRETEPDASNEVQVADALRRVLREGGRVVAVPLDPAERRHDIGTIESYCAVFIEHALTDPRFGSALRDRAASLLDAAT